MIALVQCKSIAFLRHGIRSPNDYNTLDKQLWGSFPPGFLTQKGFDQVRMMATNNFTHSCNYEDFRMVSSVKQRVMQSVVAFIMGLCPNNYEDILVQYFKNYYQQYSTNQTNFEEIINSNFKEPLKLNFDYFAMRPDFLFHGHKSEQCPLIDVLDDALYSSAEYEAINQYVRQHSQYESVLKLYRECIGTNVTTNLTITQLKKFYSSILCNEAEGIYDYKLTQQQQDFFMGIFKFQYYGIDYSQPLQLQSSLSYILKWLFVEFYTQSEWSFYYGHDDNQYALLSVITKEQNYVKFAGRLVFNVVNDKLNVFLDDRLLITKFCELGVDCSLKETIKYLNRYINENIENDCQL